MSKVFHCLTSYSSIAVRFCLRLKLQGSVMLWLCSMFFSTFRFHSKAAQNMAEAAVPSRSLHGSWFMLDENQNLTSYLSSRTMKKFKESSNSETLNWLYLGYIHVYTVIRIFLGYLRLGFLRYFVYNVFLITICEATWTDPIHSSGNGLDPQCIWARWEAFQSVMNTHNISQQEQHCSTVNICIPFAYHLIPSYSISLLLPRIGVQKKSFTNSFELCVRRPHFIQVIVRAGIWWPLQCSLVPSNAQM